MRANIPVIMSTSQTFFTLRHWIKGWNKNIVYILKAKDKTKLKKKREREKSQAKEESVHSLH